ESVEKALLAELNQPFNVKEPLRIGGGGGPQMRFRGNIDEIRIYAGDFELAALTGTLHVKESVAEIAAMPLEAVRGPRFRKAFNYFLFNHTSEEERLIYKRFQEIFAAKGDYFRRVPT